jgi:acyl-CoA reductase-like NAD-dependent aldehyde dehydrogenase
VLGNIPEMGLTETTTAIQAAAKAFVGWSKTTAKVSEYLSSLDFSTQTKCP